MQQVFLIALSLMAVQSGSVYAKTCFCKALCFFENAESSDFRLKKDVACDLSLSKKKALLVSYLEAHIAAEHADFKGKDVSKFMEVTCFEVGPKNK